MGRDFIGVERDADAFALATKRIEAEKGKPQLCLDRTKPRKEKVIL